MSDIKDEELSLLYEKSYFTVYPSWYEGWGLPVAESLAHGKFCLAANGTSLREAGGEFAEYLDPYDIPAWSERLLYYF